MKNLLLTLTLLVFTSLITTAQENRHEVVIHLNDGKTVEGMIEFDLNAPWTDQKSISIFDKSLKDQKKIKRKQRTKYKASKVEYFEANGRTWESKKIMMPEGEYGGGRMQGVPSYTFLERIEKGAISIYMGYSYPPKVISGDISFATVYSSIRNNPNYFVIKHDSKKPKVKYISNINIDKWIKDAPETLEKFEAGEYGNFKRKKGKKFGNFLKSQMDNERPDVIIRIIKDYNLEKK